MAENENEQEDPVVLARKVIGAVVPEFLLNWVMSFLDDENPDLQLSQEVLAATITQRFETQFDPQLLAFLKDAARQFGPFGVALAAASLVPWPAMAERLLPSQSVAHASVKNQQLAQALGTHEDSAWNWMLDLVREHADKATRANEGLPAEAVKAMTDSIMDSMQNQLAHALRVTTLSHSWDDLLQTAETLRDRAERMHRQVAEAVDASATHTWENIVKFIEERGELVDKADKRDGRLTGFVQQLAEGMNISDGLDMSDLDTVDFDGILFDVEKLMAARVRVANALNWSVSSDWNQLVDGIVKLKDDNSRLAQQVQQARSALLA